MRTTFARCVPHSIDHPVHEEPVTEDGNRPRLAGRQPRRWTPGRLLRTAVGGALLTGLESWLICGTALLLLIKATQQVLPELGEARVGWALAAAGWSALVITAADWFVRTAGPTHAPATTEQPADITPGSGV